MGLIVDYMGREEKYIQFAGDDGDEFNPPAGDLTFDITIEVTNGLGNKNPLSQVTEVTVNIDGGTAGTPSVNGFGSSCVVAIEEGAGTLTVAAASAGTVKLSLEDSGETGLDVSEKVTVKFTAA